MVGSLCEDGDGKDLTTTQGTWGNRISEAARMSVPCSSEFRSWDRIKRYCVCAPLTTDLCIERDTVHHEQNSHHLTHSFITHAHINTLYLTTTPPASPYKPPSPPPHPPSPRRLLRPHLTGRLRPTPLRAPNDQPLHRLLHLIELIILQEERKWQNGRTRTQRANQQIPHRLLIRLVNRQPHGTLRRIQGVIPRDQDAGVDGRVRDVGREVLLQFRGHVRGPDSAANGRADRAADLEDGQPDGRRGGDLLVGGRGLDAELDGDVEEAAADADGDLGADDGGGAGVCAAVGEHEAHAEQVDAGAEGDVVLVVGGVLDEEGDDEGGDGGGEAEDARDIAGCDDGFALHDDEVRVEVGEDGEVECHWVGVVSCGEERWWKWRGAY